MDRGRTGRAGILDPGGRLEAQVGRGLQHQRGGEILGREAGIEMTEHDFVDLRGAMPASASASVATPDDQALDGFGLELAERRMGPTHDAAVMRSPLPKFGRFPRPMTPSATKTTARVSAVNRGSASGRPSG